MARYKVLRSVAHAVGHSFTSLMNYGGDDYVMGHLLTQARATGESTLLVDLLTGHAAPATLLTPPVARSVAGYVEWLPKLVQTHQTDMRWVRAARMTVAFDLSRTRESRHSPTLLESPYVCRVEIEDDRGRMWVREQVGWWYPETTLSHELQPGRPDRHWLGGVRAAWDRLRARFLLSAARAAV